MEKPIIKPENPNFSSGPCAKRPGWKIENLKNANTGRSHRSGEAKSKLKLVIDKSKQLLNLPDNYVVGIMPGSDTGALEASLWSLLGLRGVDILAWENFGKDWVQDVVKQLKLSDLNVHDVDYGDFPDVTKVNFKNDVIFTWNGTTSGVKVPNVDWIPDDREGLTICDATSAIFAMPIDYSKCDVITWSWQKVLGGEAAHGMIAMSPRAIKRLETYKPPWPLPKLFRLTKNNKLNEDIFLGATINTPSMLAVEDYLFSLKWVRSIGGLDGMISRCNLNAGVIFDFIEESSWLKNLAESLDTRSNTSVCLVFDDSRIENEKQFAKNLCARLEKEGVAFDIGSYRDAPAGLRIWCGGTVELDSLRSLVIWIKWAFEMEISSLENNSEK